MRDAALNDLLHRSVSERADAIDKLWESIGADELELTDAQTAELNRRLAYLDANPADGRSWDDVKADLCRKL